MKALSFVTGVVAVCVMSVSGAHAEELTICVKRSGSMYLVGPEYRRQACKPRYTIKTVNTEGIQGPSGPVGPQGPQGEQGPRGTTLHLIDGIGQDLGLLTDFHLYENSIISTYIKNTGVVARFQVSVGSASLRTVTTSKGIHFEFPDCEGRAYMQDPVLGQHMIASIPLGLRYFTGTDDTGGVAVTRSRYSGGVCTNTGLEHSVSYELEEIQLPFSEPIVWPLTIVSE